MILLILTLVSFYLFFRFKIHVLCKKDAEHVLQQNADSYYETFTDVDLQLRGVANIEEYRHRIKDCCVEATVGDTFRIGWAVVRACFTLCRARMKTDWFDSIKCAFSPWTIGIVDDTGSYEDGIPHTRGEVIFITRETLRRPDITNTMMHEKIHTYQKTYPASVENYLRRFHFTPDINRRENISLNGEYVRANSDTNEVIYADKNKVLLKAVYLPNAETIRDVQFTPCNSQYCEHPYERMVYDIMEFMNFD